MLAYNHAKRLKRLRGLTPHEFVCAQWQKDPTIFTRDPTQLTLGLYSLASKQLWKAAKPLIRQAEMRQQPDEFAVLIVDDTVIEKPHTDENALICPHYDHAQRRYVRGLNLVTLLYQGHGLALPIAAELVEKTQGEEQPDGRVHRRSPLTENELLRTMLRQAQQQVVYGYLLADSWYASAENMNTVRDLGHGFIFALEKSRTVALDEAGRKQGRFVALEALDFPGKQPLRVYLRSVPDERPAGQIKSASGLRVYLRSVPEAVLVRQVFTNQDGSSGTLNSS